MNFTSLRFRYTAMFCGIGVIFILSTFLYTQLISQTEQGMTKVGQTFNLAISAVLNADRDLYQSRVAELSILHGAIDESQLQSHKADFEENAKQALDRMEEYRSLMKDYHDILAKLNTFQPIYDDWISSARMVFELVEQDQLVSARELSDSKVLKLFQTLREFYNTAGEDADQASADLSRETIGSVSKSSIALSIFSLIVVTLTFAIGTLGPKSLSNLILSLSDEIKALNSGDGDLTRRINSDRTDEIGQLANDFDELISGLGVLISSILEQSKAVIDGVENLSGGVKSVQATSQQQTDKVDSIVTAVNEMSYAVKEVAQNAISTSEQINEVNRLTQEGTLVTQMTVSEMERLSKTINTAADVIGQLSEYSNDIASVLDVIKSIAEQTNLLALNAAIEAARAGEQGRGFAVVADEVRSLAGRTQESTQSIQEMIENLQSGVKKAVQSINEGNQGAISTAEKAKKALVSLNDISIACEKVSDMAAQTATATDEQAQVAHDISENLTILSDHTNNNFNVAQQNNEQANATMALAKQLSNSVGRFKLD